MFWTPLRIFYQSLKEIFDVAEKFRNFFRLTNTTSPSAQASTLIRDTDCYLSKLNQISLIRP